MLVMHTLIYRIFWSFAESYENGERLECLINSPILRMVPRSREFMLRFDRKAMSQYTYLTSASAALLISFNPMFSFL